MYGDEFRVRTWGDGAVFGIKNYLGGREMANSTDGETVTTAVGSGSRPSHESATDDGTTVLDKRSLRINPELLEELPPLPLDELQIVLVREQSLRGRIIEGITLHLVANGLASAVGGALASGLIFLGIHFNATKTED